MKPTCAGLKMAVLVEESQSVSEDNKECLMCHGVVKEPFVRCRQCYPPVDICLECFSRGAEEKDHHSDHYYEIVSSNFPVLEKNWTAQEEIDLLDGISDCGFQNWKEVVKQVQSKTEEECEEHYMRCYIDEPCEALQIQELKPVVPAHTPSLSSAGIPFKAMDDPPRPSMDSTRSLEMSGYMPCRGDFDMEYDNYAEVDIKDIEFDCTDSDLLRDLKIAAVEIFLSRLQQRFYRKHIVRKYGLISIRKLQTVELRKQSKAESFRNTRESLGELEKAVETLSCGSCCHSISCSPKLLLVFSYNLIETRDLRDSLRPFARLHSPDKHEMFVQGLLMENFLKKEIVSLQEYRSAGICTRKGAEVYERLHRHRQEDKSRRKLLDDILVHIQDEKACQVWLHRQAQIDSGQSLAPLPLPSLGRKPAARLDISGTPGVEQLRPMERELCSSLRLLPHDYQSYKSTLIKEHEKQGSLRLAQARSLIRIDVNKTRKMYNFFVEQGWVKQPDG